jgi:hypothetical protein
MPIMFAPFGRPTRKKPSAFARGVLAALETTEDLSMRSTIILAAFSFVTTACVGQYSQPDANSPAATLKIIKADNSLAFNGAQLFYSFENDSCEDTARGGALAGLSWASSDIKKVRLGVGQRTYFQVTTTGLAGREGNGDIHAGCTNVVSFIPESGHMYQISHIVSDSACAISLIDEQHKARPALYMAHQLKGSCGR